METKYCKRCKKILPKYNRTGLCRHCYFYTKNKEYRNKRKEQRLCISCGKAIIPVYPIRCEECRKKQVEANKRYKKEKLKNGTCV